MAKFERAPNEALLGSGAMSLYQKQGLTNKPFQGKIYVTDKRVCFYMDLSNTPLMELTLEQTKGFSVGKLGLFTKVVIHSQTGEQYPLTGFPSKKLQGWLEQAGVTRL